MVRKKRIIIKDTKGTRKDEAKNRLTKERNKKRKETISKKRLKKIGKRIIMKTKTKLKQNKKKYINGYLPFVNP